MPTTKRAFNCCIEIGHVKQHLLLRRHDVQTDERDCNGNTTSTALCDYILWAARIKIIPQYQNHVIFYKRFIDDVFRIWLPHPNPKINSQLWDEFTASMNNYPGLTWEFNTPTNKVIFLDLTISITNGNISTSLYKKLLTLHLYIPPHSAHPPGLLPGIVRSTLFRNFTLCSDHNDRILRTKVFFKRLQARGYKSDQIKKLLHVHNVTLDLPTNRILSKVQKSFRSCTHVNSFQKYTLYINLHILFNFLSKTTSNIRESRKSIKFLKR